MQGSNPGSSQSNNNNNNLGLGVVCSQLVSDHPNKNNLKASERATTITTNNNNNNNNNNSNSSSSGNSTTCGSSTSNNGIFSKSKNSILKRVTKVVSSTDEEQEAFLAEIDSNLPNMLSRTFMGQDARFSFILFFSVFSFSLVLGLFVIQASYAWHNYQLLEMLGREDFSEEFFYLHYYDPPEPLGDVRPVPSLRVNTSFYVH